VVQNPFAGIARQSIQADNESGATPDFSVVGISFTGPPRELLTMAPCSKTELIVVVEDPSVSRLVKAILRRQGKDVVVMEKKAALKLIENVDERVVLLITNQPETFAGLLGVPPMLYLTSSPDWELASRLPRTRVLQKPFHTQELVDAVRNVTIAQVAAQ
jgi:DNA-binding NtrC family response regulator